MLEKVPENHWDPNLNTLEPVCEEQFIYTYNEQQEAGTWRSWHSHQRCGELISVTSGNMVVISKQGSSYAQKNRAIWIPANLEHEWYMPVKTANRSLHIHTSALHDIKGLDQLHVIKVTPLLRELIASIDDVKLELADEANKRLGLVLIDRISLAHKCEDTLPMPYEHKLVELCTQLLLAPDTSVTLSDWSEQLNISSKTLARIFVRDTGLNFRAWQNQLRMEYAHKDLEGGRSVTDAALNCGYNSLSSFIAAFKKHYGHPPGVHKRSF